MALLKQISLPGFNPYTAPHGTVGVIWVKLLDFMKDQFGANLKQTALKRHVDELMAKRTKELEDEKFESGTNKTWGDYEQLLDDLLVLIQEHEQEKSKRKESEAVRKEQDDIMIGEIRDAALKRVSEREDTSKAKRKRGSKASLSSGEEWIEVEREIALERSKERNENIKAILEAQLARDEQRSRENQAFFQQIAQQNQQILNLIMTTLARRD